MTGGGAGVAFFARGGVWHLSASLRQRFRIDTNAHRQATQNETQLFCQVCARDGTPTSGRRWTALCALLHCPPAVQHKDDGAPKVAAEGDAEVGGGARDHKFT